jgi:phage-related protein
METFTWIPAIDARKKIKPAVLSAKFGDGYEQRAGNGINTMLSMWALEFRGKSRAEAALIEAFLVARAGVEAFYWVDPDGVSGTYICREWSRTELGAGRMHLSADFEEVPA